ncbi:DUF4912 domain-containing protein [Heyndrickxia sp. MSNUG]|uniref:DUF4912 domain-containing protein n=1 Tax=Heyndrickxia sp. MSNUG TaxID=3136677 RepID=UPI003C30EB21
MAKHNNFSISESDYLSARILSSDQLFVFWKLQDEKVKLMADYFNLPETKTVKSLRLYEITTSEGTMHSTVILEVILRKSVSSWLFKGISEKRNYEVELGIKRNEEDFFPMLRSNPIILNVKSITPERCKHPLTSSPEWTEKVSTYTYYENIEGSTKK